jgi:hypothetical protein
VKNGRLWVLGLLLLGSCAGIFAVWHWSRPENAVRWTFTQFHMSLQRKRLEPARQIAADMVTVDGLPMAKNDFVASYVVQAPRDALIVAPCPGAPGHWEARMGDRAWCFVKEGREWKLHRVGRAPCDEK